ncbi:MAG: transketolase, partial [Deltaproteobacteria bacterium]|nr:transketolase [Deltaproteobacteria bacterium]
MRSAFAQELTDLAASDERVILLIGDIGNHMFDDYQEKFPSRFINCGIAEANMVSMAAGLAICGMRPFIYTFTAFDTTRCFEQIRVDLCYQNLPVVIIGLGGGLTYAPLGPTHYICEDIAIMRSLPNMTVLCPGDAVEVRCSIRGAMKQNGPVYIRIGKKNEPVVHKETPEFQIGKAITCKPGNDVCIITTGTILPNALKARELLKGKKISALVVHFHTIKPFDLTTLSSVFSQFDLVVTLEEHSLIGGLGSAIAEWYVDNSEINVKLLRLGTRDEFLYTTIH